MLNIKIGQRYYLLCKQIAELGIYIEIITNIIMNTTR